MGGPHLISAAGITGTAITKRCSHVIFYLMTPLLSDENSGPN